jgi:lactoylglutathione lyase
MTIDAQQSSNATAREALVGRELSTSMTVKDLRASTTWYRDVVGFTVDQEYEREGKLRAVAMRAGSVRILLNQDDGAKGWDRVKGQGFSLQITTEQSIDAIADGIKAAGGTLVSEPADMPWGVRMIRLEDPDGYKWTISALSKA